MLKIGLTGGIGCGKSTVAKLFAELGAPIIDADETARRLVDKGQPGLTYLVEAFGQTILQHDGFLDRSKLRQLVFNNAEDKTKLENILHPLIYIDMQQAIDQLDSAYCIVCVPLLLETGMKAFVNRILVVDCPVDIQIKRVKQRDQLSEDMIGKIINSQVTRESRLAQADDVIDNSENRTELAEQVKKLHNFYRLTGTSLR